MQEEQFWILLAKKITGEASPQELRMLDILLLADPSRVTMMENMEEFWNSSSQKEKAAAAQNAEEAFLNHMNRLKSAKLEADGELRPLISPFPEKKIPFFKNQLIYWLGSLLIILGLVIFFASVDKKEQMVKVVPAQAGNALNEVSISPGSRSKIQLPDGSHVWINSSSKISYSKSFSSKSREVYLNGEAYFDVVHDPSHPFIVHTAAIDVKALGTAFNVKAYSNDPTVEATLIHGSIEISRPGQPDAPKILLKPHEKLVLNRNPEPRVTGETAKTSRIEYTNAASVFLLKRNRPDSEIVETAWVYNKLAFEDEKLRDITRKMENWYKVKITIESSRLGDYTLTGSFIKENIEEALKMLQYLVPFKYSIQGNEVRIFE